MIIHSSPLKFFLQPSSGIPHFSQLIRSFIEYSLFDRPSFSIFLVFIKRFLDFIQLLGVDCVEDVLGQFLPMINDFVPFFPSFSVFQQWHIIIYVALLSFAHTKLYFPFLFQVVFFLWGIPIILFLLYLGSRFEVVLIILKSLIVLCFLLLNGIEYIDQSWRLGSASVNLSQVCWFGCSGTSKTARAIIFMSIFIVLHLYILDLYCLQFFGMLMSVSNRTLLLKK